jgi:hypothetical protein
MYVLRVHCAVGGGVRLLHKMLRCHSKAFNLSLLLPALSECRRCLSPSPLSVDDPMLRLFLRAGWEAGVQRTAGRRDGQPRSSRTDGLDAGPWRRPQLCTVRLVGLYVSLLFPPWAPFGQQRTPRRSIGGPARGACRVVTALAGASQIVGYPDPCACWRWSLAVPAMHALLPLPRAGAGVPSRAGPAVPVGAVLAVQAGQALLVNL